MVQAWSTFLAEKWDKFPLSNVDHASMNHTVLSGSAVAFEADTDGYVR